MRKEKRDKGELGIPTWAGEELREEERKSYRYPPRGGRRTKKRKKTWGVPNLKGDYKNNTFGPSGLTHQARGAPDGPVMR